MIFYVVILVSFPQNICKNGLADIVKVELREFLIISTFTLPGCDDNRGCFHSRCICVLYRISKET